MQTCAHYTYPVTEADFSREQLNYKIELTKNSQFKPHLFDLPKEIIPQQRQKRKRRTFITRNMEPLRGVPPLRTRYKYKPNEAAIPIATRRGLTEEQLKSIDT